MKSNVCLLLLALAFWPISLFAQENGNTFDSLDVAQIQVFYDMYFTEDSTHLDWVRCERDVLLLGNTMSRYINYNHFRNDYIREKKLKDGTYWDWINTSEGMQYRYRFHFMIYKNYPVGKMTVADVVSFTGWFKYEEEMNAFDWEILDDTLMVGGYLCQKAVCQYGGRTWEAWFTDELPFEDGPYKFHGLPGLILKVADTCNHYRFDFVSVEVPPEGTEVEWYNSGSIIEMTTREEFLRIQEEARQNVMSHFDERTSPEAQKRACYAMKIRNNPIELK